MKWFNKIFLECTNSETFVHPKYTFVHFTIVNCELMNMNSYVLYKLITQQFPLIRIKESSVCGLFKAKVDKRVITLIIVLASLVDQGKFV